MGAWILAFALVAVLAFWTMTLLGADELSRDLRAVRSRNLGLQRQVGELQRDVIELRRQLLLEKAKSNPPDLVPVHLRPRRPFIVGQPKGGRS